MSLARWRRDVPGVVVGKAMDRLVGGAPNDQHVAAGREARWRPRWYGSLNGRCGGAGGSWQYVGPKAAVGYPEGYNAVLAVTAVVAGPSLSRPARPTIDVAAPGWRLESPLRKPRVKP